MQDSHCEGFGHPDKGQTIHTFMSSGGGIISLHVKYFSTIALRSIQIEFSTALLKFK